MKKINTPKEFQRDLTTQLKFPTLSWSSVNSWMYDKEQWYSAYVLGIRTPINPAMQIGVDVGEKIILDKKFLPQVKRYDVMEKELKVNFSGILLRGHIDTFNSKTKDFCEYKTSLSKTRWNQKISEDHGQLLFYFLLIYITYQIPPEKIKCHLYFIHCEQAGDFSISEGDVQCFEVKKTLVEVLNFAVKLKKIHAEMVDYVKIKE